MNNIKIKELLDVLNDYAGELKMISGIQLPSCSLLESDIEALNSLTDSVIALICKIGIDQSLAPNSHGIILDGCLEKLNEIRQEIYNKE